jgi:chromosomal replication initiator protein
MTEIYIPPIVALPEALRRCPRLSCLDVQRATADYYGLGIVTLISDDRRREIARPRQVAMWLARELTHNSYPAIGRRFGGRDHTTVWHAWRRIELLRATDDVIAGDVAELSLRLRRVFA